MAEPFLSEIRMMSFQYAPKGWALCNGQLLPINQNQALFSLLGTTYGGDGRVNFALPDSGAGYPSTSAAATPSVNEVANKHIRSPSPSCRRIPMCSTPPRATPRRPRRPQRLATPGPRPPPTRPHPPSWPWRRPRSATWAAARRT